MGKVKLGTPDLKINPEDLSHIQQGREVTQNTATD